jgi:hypothetical protein
LTTLPHRKDNNYKTFVEVLVRCKTDGTKTPLIFRVEDKPIKIDRVLDVRNAASLRGGGQGQRYTCRINGKEIYLFEDGPFWFVENEQYAGFINNS